MTVSLSNNIISGQTPEGYDILPMSLTTEDGFSSFRESKELGEIFISADQRSFVGLTQSDGESTTVVGAYENTSPLDVDYSENPVKNFQISS